MVVMGQEGNGCGPVSQQRAEEKSDSEGASRAVSVHFLPTLGATASSRTDILLQIHVSAWLGDDSPGI